LADDVVIPEPHLGLATNFGLAIIALVGLFFVIRPELWVRLWFDRVDPRPAGLMRIGFGFVVLWTFTDLLAPHHGLDYSVARFLFTDEGIWLTDMARNNYGGDLAKVWDPRHGFEHWYDVFHVAWGRGSFLHFRSDPPFVFGVYTAMCISLVLMILGVWTRWTTILSWILVESVYRYSPLFYTGGDTVTRVFLFLGMFAQWGQAYSIDSWRRNRRVVLHGKSTTMPPLRPIAAWPMRLMMLQLAIIYCATGLLKSGNTWADGTALFFSLNLDHFYRWPQTQVVTIVHYLGVLPLTTVLVRWWEALFPLALIGAAINVFERERRSGAWPLAAAWRRYSSYAALAAAWGLGAYLVGLGAFYYIPDGVLPPALGNRSIVVFTGVSAAILPVCVAAYHVSRAFLPRVFDFVRLWLLGKRFWLVIGFGMHIGIDVGMNVGTFAEVMMAVYLAWLSGPEIDAFWRYTMSRPLVPGEGARPLRKKTWRGRIRGVFDRLRYRAPGRRYVVFHHPDEPSIRRAALLRFWDLGERLEFVADEDVPSETLHLRPEGGASMLAGSEAARWLVRIFPGLWCMRPFRRATRGLVGGLALRILRQRP
jgi:hypothetical protein